MQSNIQRKYGTVDELVPSLQNFYCTFAIFLFYL